MSEKAGVNSHHLPPSPGMMLLIYRPNGISLCGTLLVFANGVELPICVGEPVDYATTQCALRVESASVDRSTMRVTGAFPPSPFPSSLAKSQETLWL